jgi:uncharacterized protein
MAGFFIQLYREKKIALIELAPLIRRFTGCLATAIYSYAIDPDGGLYKCVMDLGNEEMRVGNLKNVRDTNNTTFNKIFSRYAIGTDFWDNKRCRQCDFIIMCSGGCLKTRYVNRYLGHKDDSCCLYKYHLDEYLEILYEIQKESSEWLSKMKDDARGSGNPP